MSTLLLTSRRIVALKEGSSSGGPVGNNDMSPASHDNGSRRLEAILCQTRGPLGHCPQLSQGRPVRAWKIPLYSTEFA